MIFVWTPPHFWALAIKYRDDYSRAEVPMLPSVATYRRTTNNILGYTIAMVALTFVFGGAADLGPLYFVSAAVLGAIFIVLSWDLRRTESPAHAIRLFTYSITYVTLLFGVMAADVIIRNGW